MFREKDLTVKLLYYLAMYLDAHLFFLYRVKLCIITLRHKSKKSRPEGPAFELPTEGALGSFLYAGECWSNGAVE